MDFAQIVENVNFAVAVYDVLNDGEDFVFKYVNKAAEKLSVMERKKVIGKRVTEVFPAVKSSGIFDGFLKAYKTNQPVFLPSRVYKDGRVTHWSESYNFKLPTGEVVTIYHDITESKRIQEVLKQNEEKYRQIAENLKDVVVTVSLLGQITYCSPAIEEFGGYSAEEVIGSHISKYFVKKLELIRALDLIKRIAIDQQPASIEFIYKPKDFKPFPVEVAGKPVIKNGKVVAIQCVMRDMSAHKEREDALGQAAQEWRTTFDAISAMISIHDKDYKIVRVNKSFADHFKIKPEDAIGKKCYMIFHNSDNPPDECPHKKALESKEPVSVELYEPRLKKYFKLSVSPLFNNQGNAVATVHVAEDVTKNKQAENTLKENLKDLEDFKRVTIDRENTMIDLKREVNKLAEELHRKPPYDLSFLDQDLKQKEQND